MSQYLRDPSMAVVELCFGVAFTGLVVLWLLAARIFRERKGDIYEHAIPVSDINDPWDSDEVETHLPTGADTTAYKSITPIRTCLIAACIVSIVAGTWYSYVNYTILQSWTLGEDLLSRRESSGAERLFRRAVRFGPQVRKSHLLLAEALMSGGDPGHALPELKIASLGERTNPLAPRLLGDDLKVLSRYSESVEAYRQAVAIAPRSADLYGRLGMCLALLNRGDDAVKELRFASMLDPKNGLAKSTLGEILVARGDKDEGLVLLKQAVDLTPEDVTAHNNLGSGYAQEKRYAEAIAQFRAGLALDPYFAVAYFNLGSALRDTGDVRGAMQAYETCIRMCIKRPEYRAARLSAEIELWKLKKITVGKLRVE